MWQIEVWAARSWRQSVLQRVVALAHISDWDQEVAGFFLFSLEACPCRQYSLRNMQKESTVLRGFLSAAIGPSETVGRDAPSGVAVKAPIVLEVVTLQAFGGAGRTDAALVQPVAVGVEAVPGCGLRRY